MLTSLKNRVVNGREALFYLIIFLLSAIYAKGLVSLASYFLGHSVSQTVTGWIVFTLVYWVVYKISIIYVPYKTWMIVLLIALLILLTFSIHVLYVLRPFSLYFPVWLYSTLLIWAAISGLFCNQIILIISPKRIGRQTGWIIILSLFLSLTVIGWPLSVPWDLIPVLISFGFMLTITYSFLETRKKLETMLIPAILFFMQLGAYTQLPSIKFDKHQKDFDDKVVYSSSTEKFDVVITQWMDDFWLYLNNLKNLSSIDEFLYYEPFVHTAFLIQSPQQVLVLGGENGCLIRELLKYKNLKKIDLIPYDSSLLSICRKNPIMQRINEGSLANSKLNIIKSSILSFITRHENSYDLIFVDLPDPRNLEINQYYTVEFYAYLSGLLSEKGIFITQAGSPYFASRAFLAIEKTIQTADFKTLPMHNQILTLGEWGWIMGLKTENPSTIKKQIQQADLTSLDTRWLNREALQLITSFGKDYITIDRIENNTLENPVVYKYYLEGNWTLD